MFHAWTNHDRSSSTFRKSSGSRSDVKIQGSIFESSPSAIILLTKKQWTCDAGACQLVHVSLRACQHVTYETVCDFLVLFLCAGFRVCVCVKHPLKPLGTPAAERFFWWCSSLAQLWDLHRWVAGTIHQYSSPRGA